MPIRFRCPKCNRLHSVKDEYAGKSAKCPCGCRVHIPDAAPVAALEQPPARKTSPPETRAPERHAEPAGQAAKAGDVTAAPIVQTNSLGSSFFESWGLYFRNMGAVWGFSFVAGFRALGALFSGKLLQIALAATGFFVKLKERDPSPNQDGDRLFSLSHEQLGVDKKKSRKEMSQAMSPAILAVMLGPIAALIGGCSLGLPGFLVPLLLAALVYFRSLAILMLNAGLFVKFGPGDIKAHEAEITRILKQYTVPFAFYTFLAVLASYVGFLLCCVGVFVTIPYMVVAMYVGMINTLGIQASDIEKFLKSTEVHPRTSPG